MPMLDAATGSAEMRAPVVGEPCVLLKLGEIVLKGRNRALFERRLQNNIRAAVRGIGIPIELAQREGVIVLRAQSRAAADVEAVARRVSDVMGIALVQRAWRVDKDVAPTVQAAIDLVAGHPEFLRRAVTPRPAEPRGGADAGTAGSASLAGSAGSAGSAGQSVTAAGPTFAIRPRRRDKRFPMTSSELAIHVGKAVQDRYGLPVNLKQPDLTVFIEVDRDEVFVFTDAAEGPGGLPVGMSGRALVMMSGGIDSPVAAYRMMRRGLRVDFLHFSGMPFTGPESIYKAYALVRALDRFQGDSRLYVVPFGKAQQQIKSSGAERLQIIAQRRLMLKTGEVVAQRLGGAALVTGDSLGQVSSQTLANITALDDAVELPILRPLIGMDKSEIMAEARRIGTLAISELPDEDCCSMLAPRRAETRAKIEDLRQIEKRLDAGELAEQLAVTVQEHRPSYGDEAAG